MADLSKTVAIIFQGQDNASGVSNKLADNLKTVGDAGGAASGKVDALSKSADKLGEAAKPVSVLTDAMKVLATSLVFKSFLDANIQVERFTLGMTQVTGSTQDAAKELEYVRGVSERLGLEVGSTSQAWLGLAASTKGTALEGEGARQIFEAVSGQFKLLGRSSADVAGALVQVGQGISKGKFELEDLKSIAERMPGFFNAFAESLGKTVPELSELISKGKIGGEEFRKFAESINASIGSLRVEGFEAELARLRNALDLIFVQAGNAGTFDALIGALKVANAALAGSVSYFQLWGDVVGSVIGAVVSGNFSELGSAISEAMDRAGDRTRFAYDQFRQFVGATDAADASVKNYARGVKLTAGEFGEFEQAQKIATQATNKASESSKSAAKALADEAKERQRAQEAAQKYALELEKLASNERIKFIEAKVSLDIANVQANAAIVASIFDSLSNTISSTGDVISSLFGGLKFDGTQSEFTAGFRLMEEQLDKENALRRDAFELQKSLTEAQVENMRAQTRELQSGGALIKIDGAGLQPHLEAFMWEILKTIQTRVNRDGLKLLLGV
jgi:tape measure domain-containing protein